MVMISSRYKVTQRLIFSLTLMAIDFWFNTQLVHVLYLKSMERHLLKIDCEKLLCTYFSFALMCCLKWSHWLWLWIVSLLEGFNHVKSWVYWYLVWLCEWLLKVFIMCENTLFCRTWNYNPFEDMLPLLIKILNLCGFYYLCAFLGWEDYSIASRVLLSIGNTFRFTLKGLCLHKIHLFLLDPNL